MIQLPPTAEPTIDDRKRNDPRPRIAASSYLNTAPLIWSFIHGSQRDAVELFTDTAPARCAEMLAGDEVDIALVPVVEYQRIPDIAIIPRCLCRFALSRAQRRARDPAQQSEKG
jgi:hypothetical protein